MLLNLAKKISTNFCYRYNMTNQQDIEDQAVEILCFKCGDVVYNCGINQEIMQRALYKKTFNYLKINLNKKEILSDMSILDRSKKYYAQDQYEENEPKQLNLNGWNVSNQQKELLVCISSFLEQGIELKNAIDDVAEILEMDIEEILLELKDIKNKLLKQREESSIDM